MKHLLIICILLTLTGCATWSKETKYSEATYQALHAVDALQTLDIKNHPGYSESGPFLGDHPSDRTIGVWYVGVAVLHGAMTYALSEDQETPKWLCRAWESLTIGFTADTVVHNYKMGMRVSF